ncbi:hypothetical protein QP568_03660 [Propionimicrobium lymphophilum]|uniref:hypothetical protein n=1 Tax=Propionimicrobium lymphophilum TaxID=33012 RepID=UPI00254BE470|nr:hypothetical protein [Propionimicrobium lymphophilum]MDK7709406.1 hypothetical protein [Propionimicrobium lymphophilum]MDK7733393.1 hypothetical protein [Propionimicrobium lymphophilum]
MDQQQMIVTLELKTPTVTREVACAIRKHGEHIASIAGYNCQLADLMSTIANDLDARAEEMEARRHKTQNH